ncbi:MAG: DUF192 domain-containing protein [Longimicrobiales bacterium]|nr:DUF192 domain-containing protein [Longimicrobiales bacterium]
MGIRAFFHKPAPPVRRAVAPLLAVLVTAAACVDGGSGTAEARNPSPEGSGESAAPTSRRASAPPPGHAWVIFGTDTVVAEVAATPEERAEGLMYRDEVPDGTGMLFVFEDSQPRAFWMANTYVALDVAYMDPSYRIVDIIAMEPLVTDSYPSDAPAMFALEVRQGWFEEQGIGVGDQARIEFGVQGR